MTAAHPLARMSMAGHALQALLRANLSASLTVKMVTSPLLRSAMMLGSRLQVMEMVAALYARSKLAGHAMAKVHRSATLPVEINSSKDPRDVMTETRSMEMDATATVKLRLAGVV